MGKHRTNIVLDEWHCEFLAREARKKGGGLSAFIRKLIERKAAMSRKRVARDPIFEVIGVGKGDGSSIARDHDKYLFCLKNEFYPVRKPLSVSPVRDQRSYGVSGDEIKSLLERTRGLKPRVSLPVRKAKTF